MNKWISSFCSVCARAREKGESAPPGGRCVDRNRNQIRVARSGQKLGVHRGNHSLHSHFSSQNLWIPMGCWVVGFVCSRSQFLCGTTSRICESGSDTSWMAFLGTLTWNGAESRAHRVWGWFTVHENAINTQEAREEETKGLCHTSVPGQILTLYGH